MTEEQAIPVETVLRDELAHSDVVMGTLAPILGHLVVSTQNSLFNDEIVAQVRGMAASVAVQLLRAEALAAKTDPDVIIAKRADDMAAHLLAHAGFLSHCHALTLERSLADQLLDRNAIDPVLTSMIQALISSDDQATATTAMAALAAQARFIQQQRRMELPVAELPGDLFHEVIGLWRTMDGSQEAAGAMTAAAHAEMDLRARYDEGASRLGLLSRLVTGMGSGARAALSISHAGAALFLTALARMSHQHRDVVAFATNERMLARLALALRGAGMRPDEVEEQFLYIHPEVALPEGFEQLRVDRARELLAGAGGIANGHAG